MKGNNDIISIFYSYVFPPTNHVHLYNDNSCTTTITTTSFARYYFIICIIVYYHYEMTVSVKTQRGV